MPKLQSIEVEGSRRGRGKRVSTALAEINVVPLVDVMLVLLIIFMVAAPMMQRGLDVNVPVAKHAAALASERIFVNVPISFRQNHMVSIGDDTIRVDVLSERIRQAMIGKSSKEVFLRGDGGVLLQDLMSVMDKLKEGGVEKVGIVAKLPGER